LADTLTEYAKLSNDVVERGVIEEIITADALLAMLKFKGHSGNSYVYNRESTLPTSSVHQVGDTWASTKPTFSQKTATLATVGVQTGLDLFIRDTRDNVNDPKAVTISAMAKSLARKFSQLVIKGEPENNADEPEGLDSLVRSETRMMAMDDGNVDGPGAAETELTLDRLDAMIDQVDDGQTKPDALVMNTTMRRKLTNLSRAAGSGVLMDTIEMFGHKVRTYDGIPIVINNWISDSEQYNDTSTWTSSTATTIFGLKLGQESGGFTVLHNGPVLSPRMYSLGIRRDKHEEEYRMAIYVQTIVFSSKQVIALGGIDSAA
jgi:hypothetical protein